MFKKSLAAVAVLGAFAASSFAADVTFYGKVDMGLSYSNAETTNFDGAKKTKEALTLDSGVGLASRIGVKATEQLGNGDKVAFKLEGDFNADDGDMNKTDRLWQREASLSYIADWGTLYAGRYGTFSGAAGSTDIVMSRMDVFDGGHKGVGLLGFDRTDNSISYLSPKVAGFQAAAMYSFKKENIDKDGVKVETAEGHAESDRFAGVALTYDIGALQTAVSYEQLIRKNAASSIDDGKIVTFGGNYDFDMFKLFVGGQYFEGMTDAIGGADALKAANAPALREADQVFEGVGTFALTHKGIEGYGLHAGVEFQALAGNFEFGAYYIDAEANLSVDELTGTEDGEYFGVNGRYIYKLSKQTEIRSSVAYDNTKWGSEGDEWKKDRYLACVSLTYNF